MRIAFFQMDIAWESSAINLEKIDMALFNVSGSVDILILPEMFTTGFTIYPKSVSIEMDSPQIKQLCAMAKRHKVAIIGSIAVKDIDPKNQEPYYANRMVFISKSAEVQFCDKRHLFRVGGEHLHYRSGSSRMVVEYMGLRILPLVCYDLRFPVWSRVQANDYDLLVYCASWPAKRIYVWDALLRARAIENQAYVIGVNRVGTDANGLQYNGHSIAIDYMGKNISDALSSCEMLYVVDIDTQKQNEFKTQFPVHLDADAFTIE